MMEICVLAVFNSEHNMGDDKDTSLGVAERKTHVDTNRKSTQSCGCSWMSRLQVPGKLGILGDCTCQNIV